MSRYNIVSTVFLILLVGSLALDGALHIPLVWYAALIFIYVAALVTGTCVLSLSFFVHVRSHGAGQSVALTFDDGPLPGITPQILDILRSYNVVGAFFCIGHRIDEHPQIVKRIDDEGHLVGNHTYWHGKFFDLKSVPMVTKELYDTDVSIKRIIGKRPRFFRPPYGVTNPMIARTVSRLNHIVIGWRVRSFDTVIADPEKLFRRVTRSLKGGDIILFHDYSKSMVAILPRVIDHIHERGLKIERVDKLLNERPYA